MEHTLRCNVLKCRKELGERALVTTCSHIFCLDCAGQSGLVGNREERRTACPACNSNLRNPEDAVVSALSPSEDYKTSILSGLSPNIIMECAGRALSFWAYQTTQEIVYQRYLEKTLTEKYKSLDVQFEKTVNEANAKIDSMQDQMKGKLPPEAVFSRLHYLTLERNALRRKYEGLAHVFKAKCRKLLQTQELYDRIKRKAELGQVQAPACDEVALQLQASALDNHDHLIKDNQGLFEQQANPKFGRVGSRGFDSTAVLPPRTRAMAPLPGPESTWPKQFAPTRWKSSFPF